jgi:hypothetical protein
MAMVDTGSFNTQMVDNQLSYWPLIPIWSHMIIDQHLCTDALLQPPLISSFFMASVALRSHSKKHVDTVNHQFFIRINHRIVTN